MTKFRNFNEFLVESIRVREFNKEFDYRNLLSKDEIEYEDIGGINLVVARRFLNWVMEQLGYMPNDTEWINRNKEPENLFQLEGYTEEGYIFSTSPFIYVDNNHKVVKKRTEIELLDDDFNFVKKIL